MSTLNNRFRRWTHVMAARRCDAVLAVSKWQRLALTPGVTLVGRPLWSVITPWNGVRFTRGFGTRAARRAMKSPMGVI